MKDLPKKRNWQMILFLFAVMLFAGCLHANTAKAIVRTIPDSSLDTVRNVTGVNISYPTLKRYEFHNISGGRILEYHEGKSAVILVPLKSTTSAFEYTDFLDLYFENVTTIGGRQVNAQVHFNSCQIGTPYWVSGNEDGTVSIGALHQGGMQLGQDVYAGRYLGDKHTKITVTFTFADNNEVINIPFYQMVTDIDYTTTHGNRYSEAWEGNSGYRGNIYIFESNVLNISGMKLTATEATDGNDSYLKSGAIVPSDTGQMTSTFSATDCATGLFFYCSFDDNNLRAKKTVDSKKTYKNGDEVVWEISQNINTFYNNMFTCYQSLVLKDVLPDEVSYKTATLYAAGENVTNQYGTLRYDASTKMVSYTMKSSLLSDISFYDGKKLTLKIYTTAKNSGKTVLTAKNTATVDIGSITKTTDMVGVTIQPTFSVQTDASHATITQTQEGLSLGASKTVKWEANSGYYVDSVTIDGVKVGSPQENGGTYTFSDIQDNHTVKVVCRPYLTVSTDIDHGKITESIDTVKQGSSKKINWTVADGYYVKKVTIDGEEIYVGNKVSGYPVSHTFSDIKANHTIKVKTDRIPYLKLTKTSDKTFYNYRDTVTYTIVAEQTVEDAVADNVIITDKDITKGLDLDLSTLTVNREDAKIEKKDNSFTVALNKLDYNNPVTITVKGRVNNDTLEVKDIRNTATIQSDQTAEIKTSSDISIYYQVENSVTNGTITESDYGIDWGDSKVITYHPDKGYYLESVTVDGESVDVEKYPERIVLDNIRANYKIQVVFAKIPTLTVKKTSSKKSYRSEDKVKYKIVVSETTPDAVAKDVVVTDEGLPKGVQIDYSSLSCTAKTFTSERGDNELSVNIPEVSYGKDVAITFSADIISKELKDSHVNNKTTATFHNSPSVTEAVKDTADIIIQNKIQTEVIGGTITGALDKIAIGEEKTITYQPDEGHYLKSILVDGKEVSLKKHQNTYIFQDIRESHSVKVVYQKTPVLQLTKESDKTGYQTGDTVQYTICILQTEENTAAENLIMTDKDITPGVDIVMSSIKVTGLRKKEYGLQTGENKFSIQIPKLEYGKKVIVQYQAVIRDEKLSGKEIRNMVAASCDGMENNNPVCAETTAQIAKKETPVVIPENTEIPKETGKPEKPYQKQVKVSKQQSNPVDSKPENYPVPETGDTTAYKVSLLFFLLSGISLWLLVYKKRTKKQKV